MRKWPVVAVGMVVGLGLFALVLAGSLWSRAQASPTSSSTVYLPVLFNSSAVTAPVGLVDYAFRPQSITITTGTTVVWTNTTLATGDPTNHTVTQVGPTGVPISSGFNSGTLAPGNTFSVTFTTPGTYNYHCNFHYFLGMVGTVNVVAASPAAAR